MTDYDVVIADGTFYDGTGAPGVRRHVGIRDGAVAALSAEPLPVGPGAG